MQENKEERIMKQIKLEINIEACHYDELTEKDRKLIDAACEATKMKLCSLLTFCCWSRRTVGK